MGRALEARTSSTVLDMGTGLRRARAWSHPVRHPGKRLGFSLIVAVVLMSAGYARLGCMDRLTEFSQPPMKMHMASRTVRQENRDVSAAAGRRWALFLGGMAAPMVSTGASHAKVVPSDQTTSRQEAAGLSGQSNKDVAKYADLGDGLKANTILSPKFREGDPASERQVQKGDRVTVDLIGRLTGYNGLVFARTQDKSGFSEKPLTFTVGAGEVIPGLDRGIMGMRKGEQRRLVIPGNLGYPRPIKEEDFGKPGTLPNPMDSADGSGEPWQLRNRLVNGVLDNPNREDTLAIDVKLVRIS